MPRRSEEITAERREQILKGALTVFAAKGYESATNKEIAEASGIGSAGLIYHYFADKEALLQAVVERFVPTWQLASHADKWHDLPPQEALRYVAEAYLSVFDRAESVALMRLVLAESAARPQFAQLWARMTLQRNKVVLAEYLEKQIELGTIRRIDSQVTALRFVGSINSFLFMKLIFSMETIIEMDKKRIVDAVVHDFLYGILP